MRRRGEQLDAVKADLLSVHETVIMEIVREAKKRTRIMYRATTSELSMSMPSRTVAPSGRTTLALPMEWLRTCSLCEEIFCKGIFSLDSTAAGFKQVVRPLDDERGMVSFSFPITVSTTSPCGGIVQVVILEDSSSFASRKLDDKDKALP